MQKSVRSAQALLALCLNYARSKNKKNVGITRHGWEKPPENFAKLNVDAPLSSGEQKGATGAILRDEFAGFIAAGSPPLPRAGGHPGCRRPPAAPVGCHSGTGIHSLLHPSLPLPELVSPPSSSDEREEPKLPPLASGGRWPRRPPAAWGVVLRLAVPVRRRQAGDGVLQRLRRLLRRPLRAPIATCIWKGKGAGRAMPSAPQTSARAEPASWTMHGARKPPILRSVARGSLLHLLPLRRRSRDAFALLWCILRASPPRSTRTASISSRVAAAGAVAPHAPREALALCRRSSLDSASTASPRTTSPYSASSRHAAYTAA